MAMRASAVGFIDDEDPRTLREREGARQERTAFYTFLCGLSARLAVLVAHGLTFIALFVSLQEISTQEANWWLIFLPIWIGYGASVLLLILSWCASCQYIKLCLSERVVRINDNPSILTEVLPQIVTTIPGLLFLILAFYTEFDLCRYLATSQAGEASSLTSCTVLSVLVSLLSICQGTLFKDNSTLWISLGAGLLVSSICFAITGGNSAQALTISPFILAVAALLCASVYRLRRYAAVLRKEEQTLQQVEVGLLGILLLSLASVAYKASLEKLTEAGVEGCLAGVCLCLLALPRAQLCLREAKEGPLEDRMKWGQVDPAMDNDSEV
ncbi:unnamed protein product [Durusdinium trenchii]|uniref:Transmembrane protein n=1 Tax=Durusdinium trenchii TaxID=1381693 RepID=A0ABP0L9N5_9DINO